MHARSLAPAFIKRLIWNRKPFNQQTTPEKCPQDIQNALAVHLGESKSLLDFGCGPGNLLMALRARGWRGHYIGIDVSDKAIHLARKLRDQNSEWFRCLIEDFPGIEVDTVSFIESLYYARNVPRVLERWRGAAIFIRIYDSARHQDTLQHLSHFGFTQSEALWSMEPTKLLPAQAPVNTRPSLPATGTTGSA